ncbi:MAG: flagellar motor switch protein FliN [Rhodospirillales bacterium RIFCSPLOWO2_12_FULL_67_15]|nr:MAG: flagellar motor switch protein FliN [Rhodospirillales bacterium RIFCSPLOWO2_12_FULL_67_15]
MAEKNIKSNPNPVGPGQSAVYEVRVEVSAVLGTAMMPISQILKLGRGAVVELDRKVGEPIELRANEALVGWGEIVVVNDKLGVTMTEVIRKT